MQCGGVSFWCCQDTVTDVGAIVFQHCRTARLIEGYWLMMVLYWMGRATEPPVLLTQQYSLWRQLHNKVDLAKMY